MKIIEEWEDGLVQTRRALLSPTDNKNTYWFDLAKELKKEGLIADLGFEDKEVYYVERYQQNTPLGEFEANAFQKQKELTALMSEVSKLLSFRSILIKLKRWGAE